MTASAPLLDARHQPSATSSFDTAGGPPIPTTADAVDQAAVRVADVVSKTPLERNARFSALADADVWLKREDLQTVRSYKARGAFNLIAQLSSRETRPALVGIESASPRDRPGLLARMDAAPPRIEHIKAPSPIFHFLL